MTDKIEDFLMEGEREYVITHTQYLKYNITDDQLAFMSKIASSEQKILELDVIDIPPWLYFLEVQGLVQTFIKSTGNIYDKSIVRPLDSSLRGNRYVQLTFWGRELLKHIENNESET